MLKNKSLRKAVSMLCVLCMSFSLFANGLIAAAADDEVAAEETEIQQSDDTEAIDEAFTSEEP